ETERIFFWNGGGRKQRGPRVPVALGRLSSGTRTADYFSNVSLWLRTPAGDVSRAKNTPELTAFPLSSWPFHFIVYEPAGVTASTSVATCAPRASNTLIVTRPLA